MFYVTDNQFCHADLGSGKPLLSDEEVGVLDKLVVAGPGLENFEIIDELLRNHELAPPIDTEVIKGDRVGVLGAKVLPSAFQTLESSGQGQDMVNFDLVERKGPGARPGATSVVASSSREGRSEVPRPLPKPQQQQPPQHQQQQRPPQQRQEQRTPAVHSQGSAGARGKEVAREASKPSTVKSKRGPEQQLDVGREKRARAPKGGASRELAQEPMPGSAYFHALMDQMSEVVGTSAKSLDREEMRGEVLDNYIARHNFLVRSSSFSFRSLFIFFSFFFRR